MSVSHDMTNALASTEFHELDKSADKDARQCDNILLKQRYKQATMCVDHDGTQECNT